MLCGGDAGGDAGEDWLEMGPDDMDRLLSDIETRRRPKAAAGAGGRDAGAGGGDAGAGGADSPGEELVGI